MFRKTRVVISQHVKQSYNRELKCSSQEDYGIVKDCRGSQYSPFEVVAG